MGIQFLGSGYTSGSNAAYTTDNKPGGSVFVGTTAPTAPEVGDVWIDNASGGSDQPSSEIAVIMGVYN
jgi:fumarate hydratase class II